MKTKLQINLTVRSFAYVAGKLALMPNFSFEQVLAEAERHRQALRLLERTACDAAEQKLRENTATKAAHDRSRKAIASTVARAQATIDRIASQYVPHELAA